jgi:hypothetical protein
MLQNSGQPIHVRLLIESPHILLQALATRTDIYTWEELKTRKKKFCAARASNRIQRRQSKVETAKLSPQARHVPHYTFCCGS